MLKRAVGPERTSRTLNRIGCWNLAAFVSLCLSGSAYADSWAGAFTSKSGILWTYGVQTDGRNVKVVVRGDRDGTKFEGLCADAVLDAKQEFEVSCAYTGSPLKFKIRARLIGDTSQASYVADNGDRTSVQLTRERAPPTTVAPTACGSPVSCQARLAALVHEVEALNEALGQPKERTPPGVAAQPSPASDEQIKLLEQQRDALKTRYDSLVQRYGTRPAEPRAPSSDALQPGSVQNQPLPDQKAAAGTRPEIAAAVRAHFRRNNTPSSIRFQGTAIASIYALQSFKDEDGGGTAILKYIPSQGWQIIATGGGVPGASNLIEYGIPEAIALRLTGP